MLSSTSEMGRSEMKQSKVKCRKCQHAVAGKPKAWQGVVKPRVTTRDGFACIQREVERDEAKRSAAKCNN